MSWNAATTILGYWPPGHSQMLVARCRCPESQTAVGKTGIQDHPVQDLAADVKARPAPDPVYSVYRSSDNVDFCIAADGVSDHGDTAILGRALGEALGVNVEGSGPTAAEVEAAVKDLTHSEIVAALDKVGIPVRTNAHPSSVCGCDCSVASHISADSTVAMNRVLCLAQRTAPEERHERAVQQPVTSELFHRVGSV